MAALYALYYFPYPAHSLPERALEAGLALQARMVGAVLGAFGVPVQVQGTVIEGAFALAIIKDCSSLDVQALFAGAVLAFPARIADKLLGLAGGLLLLNVANIARITGLYFVGARFPGSFGLVHEELLPLLLIALAVLAFAGWVELARKLHEVSDGTATAG